ncbi:hypothetical protein [Mycoplasmopsis glycophila]|uniref:Uncharacterized protein n=1 Tax=Mycoplasmopsis glycophila TaxID=171285 RepID=A0A449AV94_9BACT|nr:hypothetical protein [Mycoplasmopsis glycophila]VEU70449.1 Uncharacterised protein [Mycoplasmopsis glycophila]
MELLNKLSEKLGLSTQEIAERLGLPENYKRIELLNSLGIYSIFETKEELTNYLNSKIVNKMEENEKLSKELELYTNQVESLAQETTKNKSRLMEVVEQEFNKISFLNSPTVDLLNIDELDFKNLNKSILKQAEKNNWKVAEAQPEKKDDKKEFAFYPKGVISTF